MSHAERCRWICTISGGLKTVSNASRVFFLDNNIVRQRHLSLADSLYTFKSTTAVEQYTFIINWNKSMIISSLRNQTTLQRLTRYIVYGVVSCIYLLHIHPGQNRRRYFLHAHYHRSYPITHIQLQFPRWPPRHFHLNYFSFQCHFNLLTPHTVGKSGNRVFVDPRSRICSGCLVRNPCSLAWMNLGLHSVIFSNERARYLRNGVLRVPSIDVVWRATAPVPSVSFQCGYRKNPGEFLADGDARQVKIL